MAQIDKIYGVFDRRIIFDNCQYIAILNANDAETQRYFADLIGTFQHPNYTLSSQFDKDLELTDYSVQVIEARDYVIQPHEFSTLHDVVLLSPYGRCRVEKCLLHNDSNINLLHGETDRTSQMVVNVLKRNNRAKILTIEERIQNADKEVAMSTENQRLLARQARKAEEKKKRHLYNIIGEKVVKAFPELLEIESDVSEENVDRFKLLDAFLIELKDNQHLVEEIREKARQKLLILSK